MSGQTIVVDDFPAGHQFQQVTKISKDLWSKPTKSSVARKILRGNMISFMTFRPIPRPPPARRVESSTSIPEAGSKADTRFADHVPPSSSAPFPFHIDRKKNEQARSRCTEAAYPATMLLFSVERLAVVLYKDALSKEAYVVRELAC